MAKMKIKAKQKGDVIKVKAMFRSLMADTEEAEKKKVPVEYISRIVATVNKKIVFEATTSGFMSENPLLKFTFTGAKKGEKIVFTTTDNHGKTKTGKKKIK
jgi:sulfur-oxidizing protein SoxZ